MTRVFMPKCPLVSISGIVFKSMMPNKALNEWAQPFVGKLEHLIATTSPC